jgi:diguanylate cyclase (GGDEF)-like protein
MKRKALTSDGKATKAGTVRKAQTFWQKALYLGQWRLIFFITLAAVTFSMLLGYALILLFAPMGFHVGFAMMLCLVMPIIMAPPLAWVLTRQFNLLLHTSRELFQMANYDAQTGFLSRVAFMDHLDRLNDIAMRHKSAYAIAWLDIDHFKAINDNYGHAAGDKVLVDFSRKVRSLLRKSDFVGRLGGDEFVAALPSTSEADAMHVAENIRSALSEMAVDFKGHDIHLTASIGIAVQWPSSPLSVEELLSKADMALYSAKQSGRNRVAGSSEEAGQ